MVVFKALERYKEGITTHKPVYIYTQGGIKMSIQVSVLVWLYN